MGEVYRAKDLRLKREVAIKVLRSHVTNDPRKRQRFEREAQAIAALSHPHICALYDVGSDNGIDFLVMEYLEGDTLERRLLRGSLPLEQVVRYAIEIASALDQAHCQGIVHRDLKPTNIMLTRAGAKLLDFGLAKWRESEPVQLGPDRGDGLPETRSLTIEGTILGTLEYMAPEQVEGRKADARADVFAFGAIVYEMATGRKAFTGRSHASLIAAILTADPAPMTTLEPLTSPAFERIVRKCLAKDPEVRWQTARDLLDELKWVADGGSLSAVGRKDRSDRLSNSAEARLRLQAADGTPQAKTEFRQGTSKRRVAAGVSTAAAIVLIVSALFSLSSSSRSELRVAQARQLTSAPGLELDPAISPDGKMLAFASGTTVRTDIYVQQLTGGEAINLTAALPEIWNRWPRWSPDGSVIAFVSRGYQTLQEATLPRAIEGSSPTTVIRTVPYLGGTVRKLVEATMAGHAWAPDGKHLVYMRGNEIHVSTLDGNHHKIAVAIEPHSPSWSPDGKWIAFGSGNGASLFSGRVLGNLGTSALAIVPASGGQLHQLTDKLTNDASPVWTSDSKSILFLSNRGGSRDVFQQKLSNSGEGVGEPLRITTGLNGLSIDLSSDGQHIAYSMFLARANLWSIAIPESGPISGVGAKPVTTGSQMIEGISVTRDGAWIGFDSNLRGNQDIYKMHRATGKVEQLTTHPSDDFFGSWSPDTQSIAFYSHRNGSRDVYVMSAEGTHERQITNDSAQESHPDWSATNDGLVFFSNKTGRDELFIVTKENGTWGSPRQLTEGGGIFPRWSPDGRLVAYISNGLRVISATGGESTVLVPASPAFSVAHVAWSNDSKTIYFKASEEPGPSLHLWSVPATGGPIKPLVRFEDVLRPSSRFEFSSDGKEFFFTISERESDLWLLTLGK
jgi:serine/threonine protein kinase/dipeptidyl aminopeptidase/acylaminoacyl peptidase